jgi:hypothetical protein
MLRSPWSVYLEIPTRKTTSLVGTSVSVGGVSGAALAWLRTLEKIYTFSHCSDFWCYFDSTGVPSSLPTTIRSIRVFRGKSMSILAAEDASNARGGRLLIECEAGGADEMWLKVLLFVISNECGEHWDIINGIVASSRKPKQPPLPSRPGARRPTSSSSYPSGPSSIAPSSQTEALIRIELWIHSAVNSAGTNDDTTTPKMDVDGDVAIAPRIVRLIGHLRAYLDRDESLSIRYQPHGGA